MLVQGSGLVLEFQTGDVLVVLDFGVPGLEGVFVEEDGHVPEFWGDLFFEFLDVLFTVEGDVLVFDVGEKKDFVLCPGMQRQLHDQSPDVVL